MTLHASHSGFARRLPQVYKVQEPHKYLIFEGSRLGTAQLGLDSCLLSLPFRTFMTRGERAATQHGGDMYVDAERPGRSLRFIRWVGVALVVTLFALGLGTQPARGSSIIAVDSTDDSTDTDGNCTLREAVIAANTDSAVDGCPAGSGTDTITLPAGNYVLSITGTDLLAAKGDLNINESVVIAGAGTGLTVLKPYLGVFDEGLFDVRSGVTIIDGMTIRDFEGFGVVSVAPGSEFHTSNSEFISNDTVPIYASGYVEVDATLFYQNSTTYFPGAIYAGNGLLVKNSTFLVNHAGPGIEGGAIRADGPGLAEIINSTFNSNISDDNGGAISIHTEAYLENVTVSQNYADYDADGNGDGGGVWLYGASNATTISNSIIADNYDNSPLAIDKSRDCAGLFTSGGYNLIGRGTNCSGFTNGVSGDQVGTDASPLIPLLLAPDLYGGSISTQALSYASPALDAGDPAGCKDKDGVLLSTDQRGFNRHVDGDGDEIPRCDIGAFENFGQTFLPLLTR